MRVDFDLRVPRKDLKVVNFKEKELMFRIIVESWKF